MTEKTVTLPLTNPYRYDIMVALRRHLDGRRYILHTFEYDNLQAKIQGLSVQVGELFADLYKDPSANSLEALEAYKSLRRLLPREENSIWENSRHIGATAAHKATQGF